MTNISNAPVIQDSTKVGERMARYEAPVLIELGDFSKFTAAGSPGAVLDGGTRRKP